MPAALPPAEPAYAYVVEYRPLDRCFPPACHIRSRSVEGYANQVQADGDVGSYVRQGSPGMYELTFQRGVEVRGGETYDFDLPSTKQEQTSELDVYLSATMGGTPFEADVIVTSGPETLLNERVTGKTLNPAKGEAGRSERFSKHARIKLPSRVGRAIHISIVNRSPDLKLNVGSPLVMRRVEGREPRQALVSVFDAVPFHLMRGLFSKSTGDKRSDWLSKAVAETGVYFPLGQSMGQGTCSFLARFFTGGYFKGTGWPGMFGEDLDPVTNEFIDGPLARAAEIGFITHFMGHNGYMLPNQAYLPYDIGNQSEMEHPESLTREINSWANDHPHDDEVIVMWNNATHAPYGKGRKGSAAPPQDLPDKEKNTNTSDRAWPNVLDAVDRVEDARKALARGAPNASRVNIITADHSTGCSTRMKRRAYRTPTIIKTDIGHGCTATAEEANTPFAILFDGEGPIPAREVSVVPKRTTSSVFWQALEYHFGVDLDVPRFGTFSSPLFPSRAEPIWDDKVFVAFGWTGSARLTTQDNTAYAFFEHKLNQVPVWSLNNLNEQSALIGAPSRVVGGAYPPMLDEELFDNNLDPYEYKNLVADHFEQTLRLRRELVDFMAAHYDQPARPRHAYKLVFSRATEVDLFAPHPMKVIADDVPVASTDPRLAHALAKEIVIVEGEEPASIIELRIGGNNGATPVMLKCSANGLPLDVLTGDRSRLNLAVARLNCVLPPGRPSTQPNEISFSFEPASAVIPSAAKATPGGNVPTTVGPNAELYSGMKRWGYVRDIEEKK